MTDVDQRLQDIDKRMTAALDVLKKEFAGLRTGRASASLLDPVVVEVYGATMPLNQVATITTPDPRTIAVLVWDASQVKVVEKAIRDAGLGLNPMCNGQSIMITLPDLTEERRRELTKVAAKYAEQARISVRNVRRDGMDCLKKLEKDHVLSEDEHRRYADKVQGATDAHIKQIDEALAHKEKNIMQV